MLRIASRLVLLAGAIAVVTAGAAALRADLIVGYGVSKALQAGPAPVSFQLAGTPSAKPQPERVSKTEVGDEGYWLARGGAASPVMLGRRLATGDRIAITGQDGRVRRLQVVDMRPVETPLLTVADTAVPLQLVRVTCRVVGKAGADKNELVRFFVEAELPKPATNLPSSAQGEAVGRT